jgi:type I restriction enzyme S subunit
VTSLKKLGDVLLGIETGKSFQTSEQIARDDELGVLKVSAISWSEFRSNEAKAVTQHEPAEHHRVHARDLIISRANTRELVGAVAYADRDYPLRLLSDKTLRLVVDTDVADKEYLMFAIRSRPAREFIESNATGTSDSMRNISQETIRAIPIPLPAVEEQRRIAARLKAQLLPADAALRVAELQLKDLDALWRSLYREAFAAIVPVAVPPTMDSAPAAWNWLPLQDLARLESGHTPSRLRPDWWGGDVSWISLTEIRRLDGCWTGETELRTNDDGIANSAARILPAGTVCFSRTASVGFVTIMANPMATSQDFANWVCGPELDPEFLMHALIRSRAKLRALATGATHKTIYMPTLQAFQICVPKISVQKRIVARLDSQMKMWKEMRSRSSQRTADMRLLPKRLLADAFEGL